MYNVAILFFNYFIVFLFSSWNINNLSFQFSLDSSNMTLNDIFVEIPIKVVNSSLTAAYLWDIETDQSLREISLNGLDLSGSHFLEKNLDVAIEYLDELSGEQSKFHNYQRLLHKQQAQLQKRVWKYETFYKIIFYTNIIIFF